MFFFWKLVFRCLPMGNLLYLPWPMAGLYFPTFSDPWLPPSKWCVFPPENAVIMTRPSILRHHASAPDREISGSTQKKRFRFFGCWDSAIRVIHSYPWRTIVIHSYPMYNGNVTMGSDGNSIEFNILDAPFGG